MLLSEAKKILKNNGYVLKENRIADALMDRIYEVAQKIFQNEIADSSDLLDNQGNPTNDFFDNIKYMPSHLKNAVRREAAALAAEFNMQGVDIHIFNIENEIFDALHCFVK